jgi:hypothetical protein
MKRRSFIITASIAAAGLPLAYYINKKNGQVNPLIKPDLLSAFCEEITLKEIGVNYRNLTPQENDKQKLMDLILEDSGGNKISPSNWTKVEDFMKKKVHEDFLANRIVDLKGWVLSITEARQCALFSLTTNKI